MAAKILLGFRHKFVAEGLFVIQEEWTNGRKK